MSPSELWLAAAHFGEDAGLLLVLGSFVVRRLSRMPPRLMWVNPPMADAFLVAAVAGSALLAVDHSWIVLLRVVSEVAGWLLCRRGVPRAAPLALLAAGLLPSHVSGAGALLAADVHVLSAGIWAGGVLALATLKPPEGWKSLEAKTLLARFGRIAFIAFALTALTGVLRAAEILRDVSDLWTSTYGIVLLLKVAGVAAMLALAPAWKRGPYEAYAAVVVVALTAFLAAFPLPA